MRKQSPSNPADLTRQLRPIGRATYRTFITAIFQARKKDNDKYTLENAADEFGRMLAAGEIKRDWQPVGLGEDAPATYFVP
jgi:hypothetical protein